MALNRELRELRRHRVPAWWLDAKLGIFVHWTPASVPAFAPTDVDIGALLQSKEPHPLASSPYSEWYENSLRFPDSPVARHHRETYGNRPYEAFAADFSDGLSGWDPDEWARRFAATGARYVVFVSKHMDGYCLWPSEVRNPHRPEWCSKRDIVGELGEAVRAAGMRFGLYYSGGLDATFNDHPIGSWSDVLCAIPRGDYPAYADAQVRELIRRYRPSVLWNDIAWPSEGNRLWPLFRHYYAQVPDGVVNDRWMPWNPLLGALRYQTVRRALDRALQGQAKRDRGLIPPRPPHFDVRTPEYVTFDTVQAQPWECVRGMDQSFGHNAESRPQHFLSRDELLWMLVDIVAKGGNLLLNVGPRGVDAQIPEAQLTRLTWLSEWVAAHGDALFATRPWIRPGTTGSEAWPVRYTTRDETVFSFVRGASGPITFTDLSATPTTTVARLDGHQLGWHQSASGITIDDPASSPGELTVLALNQVGAQPALD